MVEKKSITFNLDDRFQKEIYDHAMKQGKFSSYVKMLIYDDLKKGSKKEEKINAKFFI